VAQTGRGRGSRLAGIEGLRAVAATSILVYHVYLYGAPDGDRVDVGPFTKLFDNLRSGVTLFFVLSGFLLYRVFVSAALRGRTMPSVSAYLRNRALRIVPAYWAILLGVVVVFEHELIARPLQLGANLLFLQNYIPAYIYPNANSAGIVPAWSVVIEVSFYLVLPILGYIATRLAYGRVAVVAAFTPVAIMLVAGLAAKAYARTLEPESDARWIWAYSLPTHADWFAAGMAVAVAHVLWEDGRLRLPRGWQAVAILGGLAVGLVATKLVYAGTLDGLEYQTPIALACALFLATLVLSSPGNVLERVLTLRPLVFGGLVSYSLFLVHDPLVRGFREWGLTFGGQVGFLVNLLILGTLSFTIAALVYRFVERPALARKRGWQAGKRGWQAGDTAGLGSDAPPDDMRVPLYAAIEDAVAGIAGDRRVDVQIEVDRDADVLVRPSEIAGIVAPLVDNALRYGAAPVTLVAEAADNGLRLTIEDRGRGIDPAFLPRLFEPNARSPISVETSPGEGLALSRARTLARQLGGDLVYEARPGSGARFVAVVSRPNGVLTAHRPPQRERKDDVKQRTTWKPRFLRMTIVGVMLALIALGSAGAAPIPVSKMAALGDSITSAWDNGNKWERSWATGTEPAVNSHRARLGGTAAAQNLAVPASRWNSGSSLAAQAGAVDADAQYVAILTGSADMCNPTTTTFLRDENTPPSETKGIPRPGEYANTIRRALQALRAKNANVKVLVASIPNWVQLTSAEFSAKPLMNLCPLLFGTGGVTADVSGFDQRLKDLNSAAQAVCAEFPGNCAYDNGAVYSINLSPSDLTTFDNFHLTASGEAKISAATWPVAAALLESSGGGGGGGGGGGTVLPDLAVSGAANPASASVGQDVLLQLQALLLSGTSATNVQLWATLPAGLRLVSAQADRGAGCTGTQTIVCNLDFLGAGATAGNVTLNVRATAPGQHSVPLLVSSSQNDAAGGNNSGSVSVTVRQTSGGTAKPKPTVRRVRAAPSRTVQARRAAAWVSLRAAVQARNATSMLVAVSRVGSKARLTLLRGSKVGSTRARRAVKSITIRPGTAPRQLILRLRKAAIVKGKRYVIVVTVRNAVGSQTLRIPVRG
jgi:peptidoglycan/LPS O-acetylase OafA/YrhL/lysophospholipase L1-like esterase/anti-sigma regulatory factor (Ser/Thr protein kinase)